MPFLTHEHSDHSVGIRGLSQRKDLPIYANPDTADAGKLSSKNPFIGNSFKRELNFNSEILLFDPTHFRTMPMTQSALIFIGVRMKQICS